MLFLSYCFAAKRVCCLSRANDTISFVLCQERRTLGDIRRVKSIVVIIGQNSHGYDKQLSAQLFVFSNSIKGRGEIANK